MSHTQGINSFIFYHGANFYGQFLSESSYFYIFLRTDVPRDEFGFYGWTEDFGPDSIVNLALRS